MKNSQTQNLKNKIYIIFILWVIFCCLIFLFASNDLLKCYIKDDENGYDSFMASIAFVGVIMTILTVLGIFFNYKSQREQIKIQKEEIEESKKDVEFNRALDIIYKQLEYSIKIWTADGITKSSLFSNNIKDHFKHLSIDKSDCVSQFFVGNFNFVVCDLEEFNGFIQKFDKMLNIYRKIVDNERFDGTQKIILMDILDENIYQQFRQFFSNTKQLYKIYLRDIDRENTQTNVTAWGDENIKVSLQNGAKTVDNILAFF